MKRKYKKMRVEFKNYEFIINILNTIINNKPRPCQSTQHLYN